jgi:DNA-binding NarL/FixJ family response regulator
MLGIKIGFSKTMNSESYLTESDDIRREIAIAKNIIAKCEERLDRLNTESKKIFDIASILTAREHQVFLLVRKAMSDDDIATSLVLSKRTIETFVASVLIKTKCKNRTELLLVKDSQKIDYDSYH